MRYGLTTQQGNEKQEKPVQFCDLLIDMRKKSGHSQTKMAAHIKVSLRQYQYMEAGEQEIKAP